MIALILWFYTRLTRTTLWLVLALAISALPAALQTLGPIGLLDHSSLAAPIVYDVAFLAAILAGVITIAWSAELDELRPALTPGRRFGVRALLAGLPAIHLLLGLSAEVSLLTGRPWLTVLAGMLPLFMKPAAIALFVQHLPTSRALRCGAFLILAWALPSLIGGEYWSEPFLRTLLAAASPATTDLAMTPTWHASLTVIPPIMAWISAAFALAFTSRQAR